MRSMSIKKQMKKFIFLFVTSRKGAAPRISWPHLYELYCIVLADSWEKAKNELDSLNLPPLAPELKLFVYILSPSSTAQGIETMQSKKQGF